MVIIFLTFKVLSKQYFFKLGNLGFFTFQLKSLMACTPFQLGGIKNFRKVFAKGGGGGGGRNFYHGTLNENLKLHNIPV